VNNRPLFNRDALMSWVADVPDSADKYLAVFNARDRISTAPGLPVAVDLAGLGFARGAAIRDLWTHRDLGVAVQDFGP
jgi:hypothetical protein